MRPLALLAPCLLALAACGGPPADHGADVPRRAAEALDCPGAPWQQGRGNYADGGPETVQDDARAAVEDFLDQEAWQLPDDPELEEAGRHDGAVLFTWSAGSDRLGAFVVRDGLTGPGDDTGWGVASYAYCDPSAWPPALSEEAGWQVWVDAAGDRVPTDRVHSSAGPAHCGWEGTTFLFLGPDGRDGEYYGTPDPELRRYLATTYEEHITPPPGAHDTGYRRDGRELWTSGDAAYLVDADGDAQQWPAAKGEPIRCA